MKISTLIIPVVLLVLLLFYLPAYSQEELSTDSLYALSLEDLMNIPIKSASKTNETLFEAPVSSHTITRQEIERAGSTTIAEALRLAPGVIIREMTNGNYDVHIRGFDNILREQDQIGKINTTTLVMIDNRPVFNHNIGGTFWEALPIDLNDVERIEVIRGPSSPLFGPNAVTGVINIITTRPNSQKVTAYASVQARNADNVIANVTAGSKITEKLALSVSGNYQTRERFDDLYYDYVADTYVKDYQQLTVRQTAPRGQDFSNGELALKRTGINGFLTYTPTSKIKLDLTTGYQDSEAKRIFTASETYLVNTTTKSSYVNIDANIHDLQVRGSLINGDDVLGKGLIPGPYEYTVFEGTSEYKINVGTKLTIRPGAGFISAQYDDRKYSVDVNKPGFLAARRTINTYSATLRNEYKPIDNLRIIAALRYDDFSTPSKQYLSYQFAATYTVTPNILIRAVASTSRNGSFIGYNYLNIIIPVAPDLNVEQKGNENLDLAKVTLQEIGLRVKVASNIHFDLDVFSQKIEDLTAFNTYTPFKSAYTQIPLTARQNGSTLSFNFVTASKVHIKVFGTVQETKSKNIPVDNIPDAPQYDDKHKNTPSFYGGFYTNFKPLEKMNLNVNGYFFQSHTQYDQNDPTLEKDLTSIAGKVLVNIKLSYEIVKGLQLFGNVRNIFNEKSREMAGVDRTKTFTLIGAQYRLQ